MGTPMLTPKQLQRSLSTKKKPKTKSHTIKNLLVSPYPTYWPLLTTQHSVAIGEALQQNLKMLKPLQEAKTPWSFLKDIPRDERKRLRPKTCKKDCVFGVNETTKLLEQNAASSILLCGDVNPVLTISHIIDLATLKGVPVLIFPNLKSVLQNLTGIGSVALSFLKNSQGNSMRIDEKIKEVYGDYQVPVVNCGARWNNEGLTDDEEDTTSEADEGDLYLYRSNKERVFKPEPTGKTEEDLSFISLDMSDRKTSYRPPIVKRVKNNPGRSKKKIQLLKKHR